MESVIVNQVLKESAAILALQAIMGILAYFAQTVHTDNALKKAPVIVTSDGLERYVILVKVVRTDLNAQFAKIVAITVHVLMGTVAPVSACVCPAGRARIVINVTATIMGLVVLLAPPVGSMEVVTMVSAALVNVNVIVVTTVVSAQNVLKVFMVVNVKHARHCVNMALATMGFPVMAPVSVPLDGTV